MATWIIWLIIAAALAAVELLFGAFAAFCPAIGAVCAAVAAAMGFGLEGQLIALIIGGVVAFIFLGPLVNKNLHNGCPDRTRIGSVACIPCRRKSGPSAY